MCIPSRWLLAFALIVGCAVDRVPDGDLAASSDLSLPRDLPPPPDRIPPPDRNEPPDGPCWGPLREFCDLPVVQCRDYEGERDFLLHSRERTGWCHGAGTCGSLRYLEWIGPFGGPWYFYYYADGRLVGADIRNDIPSYCGNTRFEKQFGEVPPCERTWFNRFACPACMETERLCNGVPDLGAGD